MQLALLLENIYEECFSYKLSLAMLKLLKNEEYISSLNVFPYVIW